HPRGDKGGALMARNPRALGTSLRGLRRFFPGLVGLVSALSGAMCLYPAAADADPYTVSPTGTTPLITYTEPTTYTSGLPIADLKQTEIDWQVGTGAVTTVVVPATKATGGGIVSNNTILTPTHPAQPNENNFGRHP